VAGDSGIRVALADADPLARRALREALLAEPGVEVVAEASDSDDAVRQALDARPDIVFMDTELTGVDLATEVHSILRAAPSTAVIVLSVAVDDEVGMGVLYAGAAGYLGKSNDPSSLPRVVRGVARGEAAISRRLTRLVVERMRAISPRGLGIRPVNSDLSQRQWEVIELLRRCAPENEIASRLGISRSGVRRHVRGLLCKLEASSVEEALEIAQRLCFEAATVNDAS
jgi:DNA-binding NarL/FixJ family response regulator